MLYEEILCEVRNEASTPLARLPSRALYRVHYHGGREEATVEMFAPIRGLGNSQVAQNGRRSTQRDLGREMEGFAGF